MSNVSIPKGTRDFGPDVMRKRNYLFSVIRETFVRYGFEPLETPAMENIETLTGKYGDEGDKLMFRILNNGEILEKAKAADSNTALIKNVSEKALRYDLTIPFARFVAMNRGTLAFPFRRYQMQAVWRADRPQKGRFREFYQCDADVVGSNSLLNEAELIAVYLDVFKALQLNVEVRLNNRKILAGLANMIGAAERLTDMTIAIDKLDKIELSGVKQELEKANFTNEQIAKIEAYLSIKGTWKEQIDALQTIGLAADEQAAKGIAEFEEVMRLYQSMCGENESIVMDLTLARGLNYYTGSILEVKAKDAAMGSIGGGGRYDDLTGIFGFPNMSGVGISFGLDRIYAVMEELNLFPQEVVSATKVLLIQFGGIAEPVCLNTVRQLRLNGIAAELYPSAEKIKKQMEYANKKQIPFVILIGDTEVAQEKVVLKNMHSGEQTLLTLSELIQALKN
jgi:histidyl-tRNA synthetase